LISPRSLPLGLIAATSSDRSDFLRSQRPLAIAATASCQGDRLILGNTLCLELHSALATVFAKARFVTRVMLKRFGNQSRAQSSGTTSEYCENSSSLSRRLQSSQRARTIISGLLQSAGRRLS